MQLFFIFYCAVFSFIVTTSFGMDSADSNKNINALAQENAELRAKLLRKGIEADEATEAINRLNRRLGTLKITINEIAESYEREPAVDDCCTIL